MIKDLYVLTKFLLSFAVSLSVIFAYILAKGSVDVGVILPTLAVFILALGVSALNQVQEYKHDAKMKRTAHRPVASGKMEPKTGLAIAIALILSASILMFEQLGLIGIAIFTFTLIWYNLVYTPLKRVSAFAVVPGALLGVIPPAIGWLSAGGALDDIRFLSLALLFFIWQVPHFWLLVMMYHQDYKKAGFPTAFRRFGKHAIHRITFIWLLLTIEAGFLVVLSFDVKSVYIIALIVLIALFVAYESFELVGESFDHVRARYIFNSINGFLLSVVSLISLELLVT